MCETESVPQTLLPARQSFACSAPSQTLLLMTRAGWRQGQFSTCENSTRQRGFNSKQRADVRCQQLVICLHTSSIGARRLICSSQSSTSSTSMSRISLSVPELSVCTEICLRSLSFPVARKRITHLPRASFYMLRVSFQYLPNAFPLKITLSNLINMS